MDTDSTEYKKHTMNAYDALAGELAEGYDLYFENHGRLEADFFLSRLNERAAILDIGCGVGTAIRYFADRGHSPVGVDLSDEMLRMCQRRGLSRLVRMDLEVMPFMYSSFDGIWAHTSLIHIRKERLTNTLRGFGKAIKVGGALFISLIEGEGERYEERSGEKSWYAYFKFDEFEHHVPSRFRILKVSRVEIPKWTFINYHLVKVDGTC